MIVDFVVSIFLGIAQAILGVFPHWNVPALPENPSTGGVNIGLGAIEFVNQLIPLDLMLTFAEVFLGGWMLIKGVKMVIWIYDKFTEILP